MEKKLAILIIALFITGCSYWTSKKSNSANYIGASTFQKRDILPLEINILGHKKCDEYSYKTIEEHYTYINSIDTRSKALLYADLGIAAFYQGELEYARKSFDKSLEIMTTFRAHGKLEQDVTSLQGSESLKFFKGEPFERSLTLFYRGLVYISDKDYENAHACFIQSSLEDSSAEMRNCRNDILCSDLLSLYCKQKLKLSDRNEFLEFIRNKYDRTELPIGYENIGDFAFAVVSTGLPPQKITDKQQSTALSYVEKKSKISSIRIVTDQSVNTYLPTDNIYLQAATNGKRKMDEILQSKENTKSNIDTAGTAFATIGAIANIIPGAMLTGALIKEYSMQASNKIDTNADIRQLHMLPDKIYIIPFNINSIGIPKRMEMIDSNNSIIATGDIQNISNDLILSAIVRY